MPRSTTQRRKGHGEVIPPLSVFDRIDSLLKEQLAIFPTKGELTDAEIEHWHRDLSRYSMEAIEFAFETHRQLAMFFPVYAQIIDLCKTWVAPQAYKPGCSSECKDRHGRGYGEADVLWLLKRYMALRQSLPNRSLTDGEINKLYDELDQKRGQCPAWRA
jgi:hypothetical protein